MAGEGEVFRYLQLQDTQKLASFRREISVMRQVGKVRRNKEEEEKQQQDDFYKSMRPDYTIVSGTWVKRPVDKKRKENGAVQRQKNVVSSRGAVTDRRSWERADKMRREEEGREKRIKEKRLDWLRFLKNARLKSERARQEMEKEKAKRIKEERREREREDSDDETSSRPSNVIDLKDIGDTFGIILSVLPDLHTIGDIWLDKHTFEKNLICHRLLLEVPGLVRGEPKNALALLEKAKSCVLRAREEFFLLDALDIATRLTLPEQLQILRRIVTKKGGRKMKIVFPSGALLEETQEFLQKKYPDWKPNNVYRRALNRKKQMAT